jgi:Holliday junction resolvase RusA-like endonuclease
VTEPMSFSFFLEGRPRAKARPRLGRRRRAFTPQTTIDEEVRLADLYVALGGPIFEGDVAVEVDFYPEGSYITVRQKNWHSPLNADVDNLSKLVMDGLQRCAFADDRHVVELHVAKFPRGECPHLGES